MFEGNHAVLVARDGIKQEVPLQDVRADDVVFHSGMWIQLCVTPKTFAEVDDGQPFRMKHSWCIAERNGGRRMIRKMEPNVPFGELSRLRIPAAVLATMRVDVLDLKIAA